MEWSKCDNLSRYKEEIIPLLMNHEAVNNLPIGILESLHEDDLARLYVGKREKVVYGVLRTPPHLWVLPASQKDDLPMDQLVETLLENEEEIPGVVGHPDVAEKFVAAWEKKSGRKASLHMKQGIYELKKLAHPRKGTGELVAATEDHLPLLTLWFSQYGSEVGEANFTDSAETLSQELVKNRRVYLWMVEGIAVSMVSKARSTPNGATINSVFTPDEFKRRGYASQAVWQISRMLLDEGYSFCSLYTDMSNPTSNSIYQRIGYEWVGGSVVYHF